jgi:hypothetical protein
MTDGSPAALRTLAFGDLERGLWGAFVASAGAGAGSGSGSVAHALAAIASLESGSPITAAPVRLAGEAPDEDWELTGPDLRLRVTPHEATPIDPAGDRSVQICRVTGSVALDGAEREVDCLGLRTLAAGMDPRSLDSVRQVLAWFGPDDAVALCSRRPRGAKGHDRDAVVATVLEPEGPVAVADPRLSTTYAGSGRPARVGLELWLTEEENQFPRRVSGEALGADADGQAGDLVVGLQAFRCHSRGRDGAGAYLLVRPR